MRRFQTANRHWRQLLSPQLLLMSSSMSSTCVTLLRFVFFFFLSFLHHQPPHLIEWILQWISCSSPADFILGGQVEKVRRISGGSPLDLCVHTYMSPGETLGYSRDMTEWHCVAAVVNRKLLDRLPHNLVEGCDMGHGRINWILVLMCADSGFLFRIRLLLISSGNSYVII